MPAAVLAAVLCAALLHAAWNAAIKREPDKLLASCAVTTGAALLGACALPLLPAPAAYTAWLFLLTGLGVPLACRARLGGRLPGYLAARPLLALPGGAATGGSYGIALWAMTLAPVAVVAALRETSIVFAVAIAAWGLRERVASAALIACGAAALRLA